MIATSAATLALLMHGAGLSIDLFAAGTLHFAIGAALLGLIRWFCRRPTSTAMRIGRDLSEYVMLFSAVSLIGAVASYPIAAYSRGFVDEALNRSDLMLHFHWLAWYRTVAEHPLLQTVSRVAYAMIYVSPAILLAYFAVADRRRDAHDFIVAVWLAAAITLFLFRFMPAVGPFAYLWHGRIPYLPVSDLWQPELIPQLRAHTAPVIDLGHLVGLVSAPSFHAAAGVLLIAFTMRVPTIRGPLIAADAAMLLATPVEGTHYLTDMVLGAVVAVAALGIVSLGRGLIVRRAHRGEAAPEMSATASAQSA